MYNHMRETKEQKMARLERVVGQQRLELIAIRKERKSLNYKVATLAKQIEKLKAERKLMMHDNRVLKKTVAELQNELIKKEL